MAVKQKWQSSAWCAVLMALLGMSVFIACPSKNDIPENETKPAEPEDPWSDEPTEPVQDGAYFATGTGEYAVIYGDYLSLFWGGSGPDFNSLHDDVVRFSHNGEYYMGRNIRAEISFKLSGDKLTVKKAGLSQWSVTQIIQLKKNPSIGISEEEPKQLLLPEDVEFYDYGNFRSDFSWEFKVDGQPAFPTYDGILGAVLEIKYTGAEDFTAVSIEDWIGPPTGMFIVALYPSFSLTQGTHTVRIRYLGGPFVQWEAGTLWNLDKATIRLSLDSQSLYFKLTVDPDGKMSAEEISE
jgi:hypothetical protein